LLAQDAPQPIVELLTIALIAKLRQYENRLFMRLRGEQKFSKL
jgi:hypothetical protein